MSFSVLKDESFFISSSRDEAQAPP